MEITIVVEKILPVQQFTKRDGSIGQRYSFIGRTNFGKYDRQMKFDVPNAEHWANMNLQVGLMYIVSFDAESRSWNSPTKGEMWFTSLTCWKATPAQQQQPAAPQQQPYQNPAFVAQQQWQQQQMPQPQVGNNNNDNIPF